MVEYAVKVYKFSNCGSVTLLIEGGRGDKTALKYLGFMGEVLDLKRGPVVANYELKPNVADHKTGGLFSTTSHSLQ